MQGQEVDAHDERVRPGTTLAGKYTVEKSLGAGAMGVVVAARHIDLDQLVAIKVMKPHIAREREAVARFMREARAASRILSEHVARVHDMGRLEDGTPYIVMEHLRGLDLDALLRRRGPLPIEEALEYVLQACEALAEAHARGIVHRDLKPSNLFLSRRVDGSALVKVLDFGISKMSAGPGTPAELSLTRSSEVIGTPLYMSPEQSRSLRDVDSRTDIWALGVILYRLLTDEYAFRAANMGACLAQIMVESPAPLRALRPDVPPMLEAAILACLEKDRSRRLPDITELANRLLPFCPPQCRTSVERIRRTQRAGERGPEPSAEPQEARRPQRRDDGVPVVLPEPLEPRPTVQESAGLTTRNLGPSPSDRPSSPAERPSIDETLTAKMPPPALLSGMVELVERAPSLAPSSITAPPPAPHGASQRPRRVPHLMAAALALGFGAAGLSVLTGAAKAPATSTARAPGEEEERQKQRRTAVNTLTGMLPTAAETPAPSPDPGAASEALRGRGTESPAAPGAKALAAQQPQGGIARTAIAGAAEQRLPTMPAGAAIGAPEVSPGAIYGEQPAPRREAGADAIYGEQPAPRREAGSDTVYEEQSEPDRAAPSPAAPGGSRIKGPIKTSP
ncbi:serine/threonine-protein kinase [Chondromyces apiculatus]|uniref:Protein kinase domain-containing protein n=1 Tax=Chondromyces apiculatus DSM 436 TaxID=1192034 RepID=A0A017TGH5_9BACT|nr:serine/threonine-protein kinase [Chondromyces apiculatus]EYF08349.1 Hypothetical protein CAP_4965 [Chondromyces apiculatus DSM 436]